MFLLLQVDVPPTNLSTIAGVVGVAFVITEMAKRLIKPTTPYVSKIPVILFPIIFSLILAILANKVFKRDDGTPFLSGNIWTILFSTVVSAASASGLYTWLKDPTSKVGDAPPLGKSDQTSGDTQVKKLLLLPLLLSVMALSGCATKQPPSTQPVQPPTPLEQLQALERADQFVYNLLVILHDNQTIDESTWKTIQKAQNAFILADQILQPIAASGGSISGSDALADLETALSLLHGQHSQTLKAIKTQ